MRMNAYYYSFAPTGVEAVDRILSAVATAGKMYHSTEQWADREDQEQSQAELIQAAANKAAAQAAADDWRPNGRKRLLYLLAMTYLGNHRSLDVRLAFEAEGIHPSTNESIRAWLRDNPPPEARPSELAKEVGAGDTMKKSLFYSVVNAGDGSAYPEFFDSMELAEFAQEGEEWGEPCVGAVPDKPVTAAGYILELVRNDELDRAALCAARFYPKVAPRLAARRLDAKFFMIEADGEEVYRLFAYPDYTDDTADQFLELARAQFPETTRQRSQKDPYGRSCTP